MHVNDCFFFFNDTATTEIYTLSLHDALPIWARWRWTTKRRRPLGDVAPGRVPDGSGVDAKSRIDWYLRSLAGVGDRKSTRLNSSHANISYAVFCLKKKKHHQTKHIPSLTYTP